MKTKIRLIFPQPVQNFICKFNLDVLHLSPYFLPTRVASEEHNKHENDAPREKRPRVGLRN